MSTIDLLPTLLQASGATPIKNLPGRSLLPLLTGESPRWRTHLFTEYHTHAAKANFYPQRTVRNDRYKLIENLLPGEINPDFQGKVAKEHPEIVPAITSAPDVIREAYARMQQPPRWELYDLQDDPYEFRNLAESTDHAAVLADLQQRLADWRQETQDPLVDETNLQRLKAEVTAVTKKSEGKSLTWGYPEYFFGREPAATAKPAKKKGKANP